MPLPSSSPSRSEMPLCGCGWPEIPSRPPPFPSVSPPFPSVVSVVRWWLFKIQKSLHLLTWTLCSCWTVSPWRSLSPMMTTWQPQTPSALTGRMLSWPEHRVWCHLRRTRRKRRRKLEEEDHAVPTANRLQDYLSQGIDFAMVNQRCLTT